MEKYGSLPGHEVLVSTQERDLLNAWMVALVADDIDAVSHLLEHCNDRSFLLNGIFDFCPLALKSRNKGLRKSDFAVCTPWATCVVYGAFRVMEYLVEQGIDIYLVDHSKNNAIHSLVGAASLRMDDEDKYNKILGFVKNMLPADAYIKCLLMENSDGLRPLEYAANVGTFRMMMTLMETERLYLTRQEQFGLQILQYFDLTEYESGDPKIGNRREKSPVKLMLYLDEALLRRPTTRWIFKAEPFASWAHAKEATVKPAIVLWLIFRVVFFISFFLIAYRANVVMSSLARSGKNSSENSCSQVGVTWTVYDKGLIIMLVICSSFCILLDLIEVREYRDRCAVWLMKTPRGRKTLTVRYAFYRIIQFLLALQVLTICTSHILNFSEMFTPPKVLTNVLLITASFGCIWSLLYFVQLAPIVGHYVISVQCMMKEFAQFLLIFAPFFLPYSLSFWALLMDNPSGECPLNFAGLSDSVYGSLKVMVNMVDFNNYDAQDRLSLSFLHIFYVFFVAILLVNFLIALLSIAYDDVATNREVINHVQRLSVTYLVESRLVRATRGLFERLQSYHFVCEQGRIYMTRLKFMKHPDCTNIPD